jgi:IS4 transposase
MILNEIFDLFLKDSPVTVMFRATMENIFAANRLNTVFHEAAAQQYEDELLFSTCVDLLGLAVARIHRSVNSAYEKNKERVGVTIQAVYQKLARIEPAISERMVEETASRLDEVLRAMHVHEDKPLPGFELRVVDGNHLAGTEHRLKELRSSGAAALPGQALVVLDPQRKLIKRLLLCEDGHANQRPLMPDLLPFVERKQCWLEDRDFCTVAFLFGVKERKAYFLVRQHAQLQGCPEGKSHKVSHTETGTVYEQRVRLADANRRSMIVRRITVELDRPNRQGETEIHLLTNLPRRVNACRVAETYRKRWTIETAFMHLAVSLRGEVNTLAYPRAALFAFAIALMLYNVLSVTGMAIETVQKPTKERAAKAHRRLSFYAMAEEIAGTYRRMMIALPVRCWQERFASLTPPALAKLLLQCAAKVKFADYLTHRQSPKRPPHDRQSGYRGRHVSTYRILQQRRQHSQKTHV